VTTKISSHLRGSITYILRRFRWYWRADPAVVEIYLECHQQIIFYRHAWSVACTVLLHCTGI